MVYACGDNVVYYRRPRIAAAIAEDCMLYFGRVLSFFPTQIFRRPWADFCETLPHDAVCSEIFYLLYGCSYVPPKNLRGENPQFSPICGPKIDNLSLAISQCGKIRKSKTIGSICGCVWTSIPNMAGVPLPHHRNRLSPWCMG